MLVVPALSSADPRVVQGWQAFANWDGVWYQKIATFGYEYIPDGHSHSVAFFPLFPLLSRSLMLLGLPFPIAGIMVSNLAFIGALLTVYAWTREQFNQTVAYWSVIVLAWCPLSLYGSLAYTEGLFLLLSTLSLRAFEKGHYVWAAGWGALTTATRITGVTLIPTFVWLAWRQRRSWLAYFAAFASGIGLMLYSSYCALKFGDSLIFLHVQAGFGHRSSISFDWFHWGQNLIYGAVGPVDWSNGRLKHPLHSVQLLCIGVAGFWVYRDRLKLHPMLFQGLSFLLLLWLWLLWGDGWIKTLAVFGGGSLLWHYRQQMKPILLTYGTFALLVVLFSGSIVSNDRYAYAIMPLSVAAGLLLADHPKIRTPLFLWAVVVLISFTIRFTENKWVA
ncbi:hypothetical protein [Stenomitos frigidus]|nr:hypothetical protein [Stenomitos frigidus]